MHAGFSTTSLCRESRHLVSITVFDIQFIGAAPELQDDGWFGLEGRIILADSIECFIAPIDLWQRTDYERQWLEAAHRLLHGAERSAFFTEAHRDWWTMWREGDDIYVHEELLLGERHRGPYDLSTPYGLIGERHAHDSEHPPSEWRLTLADIRAYVERRDPSVFPA